MSLLQKSELRLRIGPRHCIAEIWQGRWKATRTASHFVHGHNKESLEQALQALEAGGHKLPARASINVEDEYVYFYTMPATQSRSKARQEALATFKVAVQHEDLLVDVTLSRDGACWIAAALAREDLHRWTHTLHTRGIRTTRATWALIGDLAAVARQCRFENGHVVLLRSEGLTHVGVERSRVVSVNWERMDVQRADLVLQRLTLLAGSPAEDQAARQMTIVPLHDRQATSIRDAASQGGWSVLPGLLMNEGATS